MKMQERRSQAERTAATRDALVSTGRRLFAEHGYADVSTEQVVRAAGVTRGALYHQFADKAELFAAVYEAVEADVTRRLGEEMAAFGSDDPVELMIAGAQAWFALCAEPEIHRIVLVDAPAVLGWLRWREICLKYVLGLVEGLLAAAVAAGRIAEQPLRPLAHALLGAADEAALYVAQSAEPERARAEMDGVIETVVRGLATP
jgi:AcrR family transcriptional regulator